MVSPEKRIKPFYSEGGIEASVKVDSNRKIIGFIVNGKEFPVIKMKILATWLKVEKYIKTLK